MHKTWSKTGKEIATGGWGIDNEKPLSEFIKSLPTEKQNQCLLAAAVETLIAILEELRELPENIAIANGKKERSIEREKQKTARAQQKAAEAMPPTVSFVQMRREDIEMAHRNGRVLRRF